MLTNSVLIVINKWGDSSRSSNHTAEKCAHIFGLLASAVLLCLRKSMLRQSSKSLREFLPYRSDS